MKTPRLIAYYLPQYHPIPENDAWWGDGFTEWTNVAKARPLFRGHYQPHIPADLGFYDLRVPETREKQAELARQAGIEGFCYWHYWFAGKQLLERPFSEVLASGKPDFPFCLAWANASWTGIWYGAGDRVLMEQTYPGLDDHRAHFETLLPAFQDKRYIHVDDKPLFVIYQPSDLTKEIIQYWQDMACQAGLPGLHFTGIVNNPNEAHAARQNGFDACTISRTSGRGRQLTWDRELFTRLLGKKRAAERYQRLLHKPYHVYDNRKALAYVDLNPPEGMDFYPCVFPGWDNTPRAGLDGQVFTRSSPDLFRQHLQQAYARVADYPEGHQIIILKSWNEWAEGNYLEPDQRFGMGFLNAVKEFTRPNQDKRMEFKVSVIIPVYNAAPFVRQAVESALAQPETAEVVLVEDNSPDNSLEICQQLALEYPQVLLFRHPNGENRGAGPSRNLGISKSTQPYIAFLDADDFYLPARFSAAQAVFEQHSDCDGVYDAVGMYYEDEASRERWREHSIAGEGITTVEVGVGPADLFSVLIKGGRGHVHLNGLVIRRKVLAKASLMDETIADTLHEDTDWVLRLAAVGQLYAGSVTEPTSMRRVHQQNRVSAPRSAESIQRDRMRLRRATYEWISRHGTTAQRELAFRRLLNQYMKWPVVRTNRGKLARLLGFPFTFPKAFFERSYWSECKDAFSTMLRENWARKP